MICSVHVATDAIQSLGLHVVTVKFGLAFFACYPTLQAGRF